MARKMESSFTPDEVITDFPLFLENNAEDCGDVSTGNDFTLVAESLRRGRPCRYFDTRKLLFPGVRSCGKSLCALASRQMLGDRHAL
jgi:hypothetical protein